MCNKKNDWDICSRNIESKRDLQFPALDMDAKSFTSQ